MRSNRVVIDKDGRDGGLASTSKAGVSWPEALIFLIIAGAVGQLVRFPYLGGPLFADDFDFLAGTGLVRNGRWPFFSFMIAPAGPHPMILWRIIYYLQFLAFGASPAPFRVVIGVVQAFSGLALFALLCRYLNNRYAAWFGGLLWGISAIGGWDHPLSFMLCGFIAWGILWLLLGMLCVTRLAGSTGPLWPILLALATTLAMLSWGILVAVLPALPLQYVLLEHRAGLAKRRVIGWALAWLIPMLVVGAWQVALIRPELDRAERQRALSPLNVAMRIGGQLSMVAGNLTYGHTVSPSDEPLWPKALVAIALACGAGVLVRGRALRFVAVLGSATSVYLVLADSGGSEIELADVVTAGRYLYLPTLLGCGFLGALANGLATVWPKRTISWRRSGVGVGAMLLVAYAIHQYGVAKSARGLFDDIAFNGMERLQAQEQLLLELARAARTAGTTLRVPDLPVLVSPPSHLLWTVSAFEAALLPGRLEGLDVVPVDRCAPADLNHTLSALRDLNTAMARSWAELLVVCWEDFRALAWLSEFTEQAGEPVRIFKFWMHHGDILYSIDQVQAWGLSRASTGLHVVTDEREFNRDLPQLILRLERSPAPEARTWLVSLRAVKPSSRDQHRDLDEPRAPR
ncbi:MAG: hypothetical protein K2Y37_02500 [Pirellulales bacterium]|nr:hypothetical protein [Pirellulales bacterium]